MKIIPKEFLPVEIVFHPRWWYKTAGIGFDQKFFYDPEVRVKAEMRMRKVLFDKFGEFGMGEENPEPRPIIGPVHLATYGFIAVVWGCEIRYDVDSSPQIVCRNLSLKELDKMEMPDPNQCWEYRSFIKLIDELKKRFGYLEGDVNWSGLQNLALDLIGQKLFLSYYDSPEMIHRVLDKLSESIISTVNFIRGKTGTSSLSVNRSIGKIDPAINLHSNCSVQMISNDIYENFLLPYERKLSKALQPYGIHHCGDNMDNVAEGYAKVPECCFFDVGWGSEIEKCRKFIPEAFFNLRLSPVKIQRCTPDEVERDLRNLLSRVGNLENVGICCINMDYGTPDENVAKIFKVAEEYRSAGG